MTRLRWRCYANALEGCLRLGRTFTTSQPSHLDVPAEGGWTHLRRKSPSIKGLAQNASGREGLWQLNSPWGGKPDVAEEPKQQQQHVESPVKNPTRLPDAAPATWNDTNVGINAKPAGKTTVHIRGLSSNLNPSDFRRIVPQTLSSWSNMIAKVQQQRNPDTLEPLGHYELTFSTPEAATVYKGRLDDLHKLAKTMLKSSTGLWQSSVADHLQRSYGDECDGPLEMIGHMTLAPASMEKIDSVTDTARPEHSWVARASNLVEDAGFGKQPPTVMLEVYPPDFTSNDIRKMIKAEMSTRKTRWAPSRPVRLGEPIGRKSVKAAKKEAGLLNARMEAEMEAEALNVKARETMSGRFLMAFATDAEARRFQRYWNQRVFEENKDGKFCKRGE